MVGLGARDAQADAEDFVRRTGVQHPMVWDPTGASWRFLGITGQPSSVLVAPDGEVIARFRGRLALDEVLDALPG